MCVWRNVLHIYLVVAYVKGERGDLPENLWRDAPERREASS